LEGTGEKVVVEEVLRAVAEDDAGSGHLCTASSRFPLPGAPTVRGETWTDPQGGYPSGVG
jgi:hypothetical protein